MPGHHRRKDNWITLEQCYANVFAIVCAVFAYACFAQRKYGSHIMQHFNTEETSFFATQHVFLANLTGLDQSIAGCVQIDKRPHLQHRVQFQRQVGQRVVYCSDPTLAGIVKFVGATDFSEGEWVGLALDKPRGKHDGTAAGQQRCSNPKGYCCTLSALVPLQGYFLLQCYWRTPCPSWSSWVLAVVGFSEVKGRQYFDCPQEHGLFIRAKVWTNNQKINASNCINVSYHVVPRPSSDCQSRFCCPKMSSRSRRNLRSNLATIHLWRSVLEVESCAWRLVCYPRQTASESRPARRRGRADKGFPIFSCWYQQRLASGPLLVSFPSLKCLRYLYQVMMWSRRHLHICDALSSPCLNHRCLGCSAVEHAGTNTPRSAASQESADVGSWW